MFNQSRNIPEGTKNLIVINVIIFLAWSISKDFMTASFALFYPASRYFHWWQIFTHMFLHGGIWHLFFNMYALFMFGCITEQIIGTRKFLIFYFACGLGAAALHLGVQWLQAQSYLTAMAEGSTTAAAAYAHLKMIPTVGASGAIYGVLIAYAMLFPDSRLTLIFPPISLSAKWWVAIFAGIEILTGVTGTADGIAHFAHLGGMIVGALLIIYWRKRGTLFDRN